MEATAVALALGGGSTEWAARFVFHVLDELAAESKMTEHEKPGDIP